MTVTHKMVKGKMMTLCLSCERITHTYHGNCTGCGSSKAYYDYIYRMSPEGRFRLKHMLLELEEELG